MKEGEMARKAVVAPSVTASAARLCEAWATGRAGHEEDMRQPAARVRYVSVAPVACQVRSASTASSTQSAHRSCQSSSS